MMKTALVTGSSGFIGRHVVDTLRERDYKVFCADPASPLPSEQVDALSFFQDDHDADPFDLVWHCAASAPHRAAIDTEPGHFAYNLQLDAAMFTWAARANPGHIIYMSSCAAYPREMQTNGSNRLKQMSETDITYGVVHEPGDPVYGWTKLTGERMTRAARFQGLHVTVLRPFSGYGEDQSEDFPFGAIVERARRGDPMEVWGTGNQIRDWIHVDDIVKAGLALDARARDSTVNVCTGIGTSIRQLAWMTMQIAGLKGDVISLGDKGGPAGADYRVGNPDLLNKFYYPRVSLAQGVERRLEAY